MNTIASQLYTPISASRMDKTKMSATRSAFESFLTAKNTPEIAAAAPTNSGQTTARAIEKGLPYTPEQRQKYVKDIFAKTHGLLLDMQKLVRSAQDANITPAQRQEINSQLQSLRADFDAVAKDAKNILGEKAGAIVQSVVRIGFYGKAAASGDVSTPAQTDLTALSIDRSVAWHFSLVERALNTRLDRYESTAG